MKGIFVALLLAVTISSVSADMDFQARIQHNMSLVVKGMGEPTLNNSLFGVWHNYNSSHIGNETIVQTDPDNSSFVCKGSVTPIH